jgi:integrase
MRDEEAGGGLVALAECPGGAEFDRKPITSFAKAWRNAGCPGRIPHDFRRTAVRNLVRSGVPERVSMQMTGHKTPSVFARYNIVNETDLFDAARRYEAGHRDSSVTVTPPKAKSRGKVRRVS